MCKDSLNTILYYTLTSAKLAVLGQVEGLHPVLIYVKVQSIPHEE